MTGRENAWSKGGALQYQTHLRRNQHRQGQQYLSGRSGGKRDWRHQAGSKLYKARAKHGAVLGRFIELWAGRQALRRGQSTAAVARLECRRSAGQSAIPSDRGHSTGRWTAWAVTQALEGSSRMVWQTAKICSRSQRWARSFSHNGCQIITSL